MGSEHETRRILLLMHPWAGFLQEVQIGVAEYLAQRPHWLCTRMLPIPEITARLPRMTFHGAIAYVEGDYLPALRKLNIPVVDVSNWQMKEHFPRVTVDDAAVGQMAADHLMEIGLSQFAVVGVPNSKFSNLRRATFVAALLKKGFPVHDLEKSTALQLPAHISLPPGVGADLVAWLLNLPKPIGCFTTFSGIASNVIEACAHLGIRIPEDLCVLSGDDDDLAVKFSNPPLSNIVLPARKIGFEAAHLLDDLMAGKSRGARSICLAPVGVVARQSTNLLAISDPDVLAAVRYIREHLHRGLNVSHVLHEVPVNRRYLERQFKKLLGRSPLQEIRHMRLQKAKELLSGTDLSIPAVAKRSGFPNGERMAQVFHQQFGVTPSRYRRQFRLRD